MNEIIAADLYRHFGLKGKKGLLKGLSYPGFKKIYERDLLQNSNAKVSI
jgi:hypothetical protein